MSNYWVDGPFPPSAILVLPPSAHWSYGCAVTLDAGTALANYDDLSVLTDGLGQHVVRLNETTGTFTVDLGSARLPNILALVNHNFSHVRVKASTSNTMSPLLLDVQFDCRQPVAWLDLRLLASNIRYLQITGIVTVDSATVALGEIVVGLASEFVGGISSLDVSYVTPKGADPSESWMLDTAHASEIASRLVQVAFLFSTDISRMEAILDEAALGGRNFLFCPVSRWDEAFWLDWPGGYDATLNDARRTTLNTMNLPEEVFGLIP